MDKESKIEWCTRIAQKKTPTTGPSRGLGDSMFATWLHLEYNTII